MSVEAVGSTTSSTRRRDVEAPPPPPPKVNAPEAQRQTAAAAAAENDVRGRAGTQLLARSSSMALAAPALPGASTDVAKAPSQYERSINAKQAIAGALQGDAWKTPDGAKTAAATISKSLQGLDPTLQSRALREGMKPLSKYHRPRRRRCRLPPRLLCGSRGHRKPQAAVSRSHDVCRAVNQSARRARHRRCDDRHRKARPALNRTGGESVSAHPCAVQVHEASGVCPMNRVVSRVGIAAVVVVAALQSACMTPFVSRRGDDPQPRPAPTLTAGFTAKSGSSDRSLLDVAQDSGLSDFGAAAVGPITAALEKKGYAVAFDKARILPLNSVSMGSDSATTALTGVYHHPESSYWAPEQLNGPFLSAKDLIVKIDAPAEGAGDASAQRYAFISLTIWKGGFVIIEPIVDLRVAIYDGTGQKMLELRGVGSGDGNLFLADKSPTNLMKGLERAIASFETLTEEPIN